MTLIIMNIRFISIIGNVMHTIFMVEISASIEFMIAGGISGLDGTFFYISSLVRLLAGAEDDDIVEKSPPRSPIIGTGPATAVKGAVEPTTGWTTPLSFPLSAFTSKSGLDGSVDGSCIFPKNASNFLVKSFIVSSILPGKSASF